MSQESFVFYRSFYKAIKNLDDMTLAETVKAICAYALDGEETELEGISEIILDMAKPQIDANTKRREDGKKGGRPKKETIGFQEKNHRLENEKPNVNENENVNVNENVNEKKSGDKPHRSFKPPAVDEVRAYCNERKNDVDAQSFVDFYESKGWLVGKVKMKDWKAAVRTWERRGSSGRSPNTEIDESFRRALANSDVVDW